MDKKEIFDLAARELKLDIQEQKTFQIDGDMYLTKIKIGNILSTETYDRETKEFVGEPAPTQKLSIQSSYNAALKYLEDEKMVTVDDYNANNVSRLKKKLFCSESWAMLFEYKAKKLSHTVSVKDAKLRDFLCSFDAFCQDASAGFALLATAADNPSPKKKPHRQAVQVAREEDPSSTTSRLSNTLMTMRAQLLSLVESTDQNM